MSETKLSLNEEATYLLEKICNRAEALKHDLVLHMFSTAILKEQSPPEPGCPPSPAETASLSEMFLLYRFLHHLSRS